ncbi:MAG: zinc transporter [Rhodobacteraceae bacterium]|nr:MAG: zinc transporter [Paracoccaceae bacterium]
MSRKLLSLPLAVFAMAGAAQADAPRVAVDIAPVHSLVARVMDGVGTPDLIVPAGASPHEYSLRPSDAAALEGADLVFWVGEDLTPWLADALSTLSADALVTGLLEAEGATRLEMREDALFEAHDHGHGHDKADDHDHDHKHDHDHGHDHAKADGHDHKHDHDHDHAKADGHDHGHGHKHGDDHAKAEDHGHGHGHGHAHGAYDAHAWLSPQNAAVWTRLIAAQLSAADPANAASYAANAEAALAELEALSTEISGLLDPVRGGSFIVFHDAYQYFETAFDFPAAGAISISDASEPSPARIAEIQGRIRGEGVDCVLAEPQFNPGLVATVLDGTQAGSAVVDPLGSDLEPGAGLYAQMMRNLATSLADCLS